MDPLVVSAYGAAVPLAGMERNRTGPAVVPTLALGVGLSLLFYLCIV